MKRITDFLNGKKTYIGVIAGMVYALLIQFAGVESNPTVWTAIAGWTGISYRVAIDKN